jgi:hypothetical protein
VLGEFGKIGKFVFSKIFDQLELLEEQKFTLIYYCLGSGYLKTSQSKSSVS